VVVGAVSVGDDAAEDGGGWDVRPAAPVVTSAVRRSSVAAGDGFGDAFRVGDRVLVAFGEAGVDDPAAGGQIVRCTTSGGSRLPPSCHTHASVEPGLGSWLPAPLVL
jgi:hypothetical protein